MTTKPSILIVDDELGPRESLRMILKSSYEVHAVADGSAALQFLEKNPVDLITLDLKMPGLSGMEVLRKIRTSIPDVMVIVVTGYGTFKSVVEAICLNVFDYISKPFNVHEIVSVVERCLQMRNTKLALKDIFSQMACLAKAGPSESDSARVMQRIEKMLEGAACFQMPPGQVSLLEFIRVLSDGMEKRDPYKNGHAAKVGHYTDRMAQALGLSRSVREEFLIASYLHDIGKVCINDRFMNGEGRLSSTDWAVLKTHPIQSVAVVKPLNLPEKVISAIRHHHERFDGTGYPEGLSGSDIPLGARLVATGNMYAALTSPRPYRKAMGVADAKKEMKNQTGRQLDPDLVGILSDVLREEGDAGHRGTVDSHWGERGS